MDVGLSPTVFEILTHLATK